MKLLLLSVNRETWESQEARSAAEQVREAAKRIEKKVDLRHERIRFTRACASIEALGLEKHEVYLETTGHQTWELMSRLPKEGSITLNFVSPADLERLAGQLEFLRGIPKQNGLVVIPLPSSDTPPPSERETSIRELHPKPPDFSESDVDLNSISEDLILRRFHGDLRQALRLNECLGLGGYRHEIFVKGIRHYIYVRDQPFTEEKVRITKDVPDTEAIAKREATIGFRLKKSLFPSLLPKDVPMKRVSVWDTRKVPARVDPVYLRISFQDGSEGMPFPLFCIPKKQRPEGLDTIHAALISSRHFELDSEIDLCIIRNSELSRREDESFADQENLAFQRAMKTFQRFVKSKSGAEIHLYHTGLEPAVVGTYRAIMEILRWPENRGRVVVIPKLYRENSYVELDPWF
jgi:hypothetical protein